MVFRKISADMKERALSLHLEGHLPKVPSMSLGSLKERYAVEGTFLSTWESDPSIESPPPTKT